MHTSWFLSAPLLVTLLLVSCSTAPKTPQTHDQAATPTVGADETILKQDPLERNYDPHVIMKRAESFFEKEEYAEAAVEYQHFLDLHKTHVLAPYAQYRLGLSYFQQVTTRDRDPVPVRLTMAAMEKLLQEHPGGAYEQDARSKIKACQEHLAAYELYVGRHYYRQASYLAALHRFEGVLTQFPNTSASAEAHYHLALTYRALGATDRATEHLTSLLTQFPQATVTQAGKALFAKLSGKPFSGLNGASLNGALPPAPTITCNLNVTC